MKQLKLNFEVKLPENHWVEHCANCKKWHMHRQLTKNTSKETLSKHHDSWIWTVGGYDGPDTKEEAEQILLKNGVGAATAWDVDSTQTAKITLP